MMKVNHKIGELRVDRGKNLVIYLVGYFGQICNCVCRARQ